MILLRVFQETPDEQVAKLLSHRVSDVVRAAGYSVVKTSVKPYWKIPEYFEVVIEMTTVPDVGGIEHALEKLGSGWLHQRPGEAIWNKGENAHFMDESVRWAHLELIE
jgi:hypothetical protein